MWNPKRILLLVGGFFLFLTGYGVYAHFLGGIDGLPSLPDDFLPPAPGLAAGAEGEAFVPHSEANTMLAQAFGEHNDVLNLSIKVEMRTRGLVLASDVFTILEDGRVKFEPFRIALFGKARGEYGTPEINTISSDVAFLTFDKPISSMYEMGDRKIVASELKGKVTLVNNRRTLAQDDDLSLFTQGTVYYQADKNLIWTVDDVRLMDFQSKPQPTTINATGMDVYLITQKAASPGDSAGVKKSRSDNVSGVERVVLRSSVEMHLFVDARSGFLATGKSEPKQGESENQKEKAADRPAGQQPTAPDKSHVVITTEGQFIYDVLKDHAQFDISKRPSFLPKEVNVIREHEQNKLDHLICDHLELQFQRKNGSPAPASSGDNRSVQLEIQSAHASADAGKEVILSSDGENLDAFGKDLYYEAATGTSILKGETVANFPLENHPRPMKAVKDLNVIYARELQMVNGKDGQQATVLGPGKIDLYDKNKKTYLLHAQWNDQLVSSKDGNFDCLTLTGNASFDDDEHNQKLRGDTLKVWLLPAQKTSASDSGQQRTKPHHVESKGHVTADSPDLHIKEPTEHLVLWFKDQHIPGELPGTVAPHSGSAVLGNTGNKEVAPTTPVAASAGGTNAQPAPAAPGGQPGTPPTQPRKPITLNATSVEATILRDDTKNDLERLWCEGAVRVIQDGATPDDKGVDIQGDTLQLNHFTDGNILVVTGNLAQVQQNRTSIFGPEVTIDQQANVARVKGTGVMKMPSNTDFNGNPLSKPSELTVVWKESMLFDGKCAEFHKDVKATQQDARLLCQEMQVYLDHPMSFKEGQKNNQPAKVQKLLCDQKVFIEEKTMDNGKLQAYKRLTVPVVSVDNEDGRTTAPGPGMVHILQRGSSEETLTKNGPPSPNSKPPKTAPEKGKDPVKDPSKDPLQLTRVTFRDRLYANNISRTAIFYGDVKLVHVPTENPDLKIDLDHPPEGFLFLTCEQLKVFTDSQKHQQMEAQTRVVVQSQEFWGNADVVKYDEDKELVVFVGTESNPASLYRVKNPQGGSQDKLTGEKIYYWRRTNETKVEGGRTISEN